MYEYTTKYIRCAFSDLEKNTQVLDDTLNEYAAKGWRFVRFDFHSTWEIVATFEREKQK